jgi:coenzyme F420-reducing hydrogenase delta subunit
VVVNGEERIIAQVDRTLCMQCGICVAACPSGAMSLESVNNQELLARIGAHGWLEQGRYLDGKAPAPRILALVCQWSIHSDTEWAALQSLESETLRLVNLPCSGRVDPAMILLALGRGADGVLVAGCHEGECHYKRGTYLGRSKVALIEVILQQMGITPSRVRFVELSALSRGALLAHLDAMIEEIAAMVPALTPA